jgi:hypothetical protein
MTANLSAILELGQVPARSGSTDNTVAIVGLIAAGFVGVAGPVITAIFAARRQRADLAAAESRQRDAFDAEKARQDGALAAERERLDHHLAAERERLDSQLAAELERQTAELRHDRELADLSDMRAILDEAAVVLHRANYARADVHQGFTMFGRKIRDHRPDAIPELNVRGQELDAMAARLAIRLGVDDAIAKALHDANESLLTVSRAVAWLEDETRESMRDTRAEITAASEAFEQHVGAFSRAAVAALVAAPPSRPRPNVFLVDRRPCGRPQSPAAGLARASCGRLAGLRLQRGQAFSGAK